MTDDIGADVGIGMDLCRFGCASASVKALRFAWASATIGWGASTLVGCEAWTSEATSEGSSKEVVLDIGGIADDDPAAALTP